MSPRQSLTKREQQREQRRCQILMCSLDMIISRGFEAMKIRDIAMNLGISTGLFFNYFESKEAIYEELVKIGLGGPQNVLKLNDGEIEPIVLFEQMTAIIFESLQADSMTAKMFVLMGQTLRTDSAPESVKKLIASLDTVTPLLQVIRKGQQLGQIRDGDPAALAAAYWGAVQGIAESYARRKEWPLPQSRWIVDIIRA